MGNQHVKREIANGTITIMSFVFSLDLQEGEEVCHFVTLFVLLALSRHSLVNCSGILVLRGGGRELKKWCFVLTNCMTLE